MGAPAESRYDKLFKKVKKILIGKPLKNEEIHDEKLNVFWGLPIMASDAISSVAYAVEEILWVLIPLGLLAYHYEFYAAMAIVALLLILVFSYRHTIDSYPSGGGAYIVAKENLGTIPGLVAGSSLVIDYILTVAVSACAGVAAITSAVPALLDYNIEITIFLIILMTIGNLRGVKESARIFAIPTYLFLLSAISMIIMGVVKVKVFGIVPVPIVPVPSAVVNDIGILLMLRAFAAGCTALTGVEAVSNGISNFAAPAQKKAKQVLALLAFFVLLIFGGMSYLATLYHAVPNPDNTVISQIATQVFGAGSIMYFVMQATTAVLLIMAANTAFSGLPLLLSLIAKDGYAPKQFTIRGERLGYSNGIIMLSASACFLVLIFKAQTHYLLPLYAIGVFTSFTLSQSGMLKKWLTHKEGAWLHKAMINGFGALITFLTVWVIAYTKLTHGAWVVVVLIPICVKFMLSTKAHYEKVANQLKLPASCVLEEAEGYNVQKHIIVLIETLNKASMKAITYARFMGNGKNVVVFTVSTDKEQSKKLQEKWDQCGIEVPLVIKYSPYREVINPLVKFIASEEHGSASGDIITVVMPQFVVKESWENIYHNQTANTIKRKLMQDRHIAVITVPYVLD